MITQTFARASAPHIPTLADAIRSQMQGRIFYIDHTDGNVIVNCDDFTGITLSNIQAQVDACVADSPIARAKYYIDNLDSSASTGSVEGLLYRAMWAVLVDEFNPLRTTPSTTFAARNVGQVKTALKNKLDTF